MVPCGTGSFMSRVKVEATKKDKELLKEVTDSKEQTPESKKQEPKSKEPAPQ